MYWLDRIQINEEDVIIYEFFKVENIRESIITKDVITDEFLKELFDEFTYAKHNCIKKLIKGKSVKYFIILYSHDDLDKKYVISYINGETTVEVYEDFVSIQNWFLLLNNMNVNSNSKVLGEIRSDNNYADCIIRKFWGDKIDKDDDQGLAYTMKLLTKVVNGSIIKYETKGFDFDFFTYRKHTNTLINIEFALNKQYCKRENVVCTPMKYCWNRNSNSSAADNKLKYNNLWKATKALGGEFYVLNYSDSEQLFGLQHILELDENVGIRQEMKYRITPNNFMKILNELNSSDENTKEILLKNSESNTYYDQEFFDDFANTKYQYK